MLSERIIYTNFFILSNLDTRIFTKFEGDSDRWKIYVILATKIYLEVLFCAELTRMVEQSPKLLSDWDFRYWYISQ